MSARLPDTVELVIRNDLEDLVLLSEALDRLGAERRFSQKTLKELHVALDEVVSNVIRYAWPEGGDHEIRISFAVRGGDVRIEIVDDGVMFDPLGVRAPERLAPGQRPAHGGVGIHMTRQLVDTIEFARIDERNHLTMTKRNVTQA
jgi:serine/threonine-protein kinase RsbW